MRGNNQGGSLIGFIVVGVLLALVLIGGLYGLNRYNAQKVADETAVLEEEATKDTKDEGAVTERTPSAKEEDKTTSTPTATPDRTRTTDPGDATPTPTPATGTQLPQTGPTETVFGLLVVGLLTFTATHYVRSRTRR